MATDNNVSFNVGDLVWVRCPGYPWWPAKIVPPSDIYYINNPELPPGTELVVFFNDSGKFDSIPREHIRPYLDRQYSRINGDYHGAFRRNIDKAIQDANDYAEQNGLQWYGEDVSQIVPQESKPKVSRKRRVSDSALNSNTNTAPSKKIRGTKKMRRRSLGLPSSSTDHQKNEVDLVQVDDTQAPSEVAEVFSAGAIARLPQRVSRKPSRSRPNQTSRLAAWANEGISVRDRQGGASGRRAVEGSSDYPERNGEDAPEERDEREDGGSCSTTSAPIIDVPIPRQMVRKAPGPATDCGFTEEQLGAVVAVQGDVTRYYRRKLAQVRIHKSDVVVLVNDSDEFLRTRAPAFVAVNEFIAMASRLGIDSDEAKRAEEKASKLVDELMKVSVNPTVMRAEIGQIGSAILLVQKAWEHSDKLGKLMREMVDLWVDVAVSANVVEYERSDRR